MPDNRNGCVIQFGVFELRKDSGELRRNGIKIRLQGKPLQLLQALLERPGGVVSREELRDRLWPADTFVDFESGLNTTVNRLRLALGDSAEHPRYIETLARSGYRFLPPVNESHPQAVMEEVVPAVVPIALPPPNPEKRSKRESLIAAAAGILVAIAGLALLRDKPVSQPTFHQITFGRSAVPAARFGPDGTSVIYEARETPRLGELYLANLVSPESRPLGFSGARLASVSRSGELALWIYDLSPAPAKLVRVPINGGAPLAVDQEVSAADWSPDGATLAVIRNTGHPTTLEYPRGHTIYKSSGWLTDIRISPSGHDVAFMEHMVRGDDGGDVKLVDTQGVCRTLASGWASADGLAWVPSGREVWFTAARSGSIRSLYAVTLTGELRTVASVPGTLMLYDISRSGRVLIGQEQTRLMMNGMIHGDTKEKDLSWFDFSHAQDISDDGRVILFDETGEGGGARHSVYIRRADAPSAVRVGDGWALAISPDGAWAVTMSERDQSSINLVPLTPGQSRVLSGHGLRYDWVHFFPKGDRLLVGGSLRGGPLHLFVQGIDGSKPQPLNTNVYMVRPAISQDGTQLAGVDSEGRLVVLPVAGGEPRVIPAKMAANVLRWGSDNKSLLTQPRGAVPASVFRVDLATGRYKVWKEVGPADLSGIVNIWPLVLSRDERCFAYSFARDLSELFVVEGWK